MVNVLLMHSWTPGSVTVEGSDSGAPEVVASSLSFIVRAFLYLARNIRRPTSIEESIEC